MLMSFSLQDVAALCIFEPSVQSNLYIFYHKCTHLGHFCFKCYVEDSLTREIIIYDLNSWFTRPEVKTSTLTPELLSPVSRDELSFLSF